MDRSTLYIVATPIGNLEDITFRALDILRNVDLILSEDTRETSKLLAHFQIQASQISYRDQNHNKVINYILDLLKSEKSLALMSDSGTPLISDPGFKLVRAVLEKGFKVVPIPGSSAVVTALSASGLPTDKFAFLGFLPKSSGQRKKELESFGNLPATLVIYESPYRLKKLLDEISEALGDRKVCIASEITKLHEKFIFGKVSEVIEKFDSSKIKGEYVVLVGKEGL